MARNKELSPEAVAVLGSLDVDGAAVRITAQLERRLYTEVNAALEALGGKWNKKAKAHLFDGDPRDDIDRVVLAGGVEIPKAGKSWQQLFGFFETPPELVDKLLHFTRLMPDTRELRGERVLEPSSGRGAIALTIANGEHADSLHLTCVEIEPTNMAHLRGALAGRPLASLKLIEGDFLATKFPPSQRFTAIPMNPPFARQQDIDHVSYALDLLTRGGRLAAIMADGVRTRANAKARDFRAKLELFAHVSITPNPPGSFKASGTNVQTVLVTAERR